MEGPGSAWFNSKEIAAARPASSSEKNVICHAVGKDKGMDSLRGFGRIFLVISVLFNLDFRERPEQFPAGRASDQLHRRPYPAGGALRCFR